jgi:hypothetical protein
LLDKKTGAWAGRADHYIKRKLRGFGVVIGTHAPREELSAER